VYLTASEGARWRSG